jgi:outer membrane protein TolC
MAQTNPSGNAGQRVEITLLNTQISLQNLNAKRYRAGYLPSVALFGQTQFDAQRNEFNFFDFDQKWYNTTLWGVQLSLPIWDSFQKHAQVQQTKLNIDKLENQKELLTQAIALETQKAQTDFANAAAEVQTQQANLDLANRIYETTRIKYNEGVGSSLEMSQAEQQLFQTQSNYINALYQLLNAKADLDKALGI